MDLSNGRSGADAPFIAVYGSKGGAGTSTVATALALKLAHDRPDPALAQRSAVVLVDLDGTACDLLSVPRANSGLMAWLEAFESRLPGEYRVTAGLAVVRRGGGTVPSWPASYAEDDAGSCIASMYANDTRTVVVDCGSLAMRGAGRAILERADERLLVTHPSRLSMRRFHETCLPQPSGVIVVGEPGGPGDHWRMSTKGVEAMTGAPVLAFVPHSSHVRAARERVMLGSSFRDLHRLRAFDDLDRVVLRVAPNSAPSAALANVAPAADDGVGL